MIMASPKSLWFLVALFINFICSSEAMILDVGEDDGWTLHSIEDYNEWAGRLRFQVNDTLHFKYDDATDSVLVVDKDDYDNCNVGNPIQTLDGGDSDFTLAQPGHNYFITGNKSNCDQGQKLIVSVLHIRTQSPPSPPSTQSPLSPAPVLSPITITPPSKTPALAPSTFAGGSSPSPSSASTVVTGAITTSFVTLIIAFCSII